MSRPPIAAEALLGALPLFKALEHSMLQRLAARTTRRTLARGEQVFATDDMPTGMYVVVHGQIRLLARSPSGGERLTGVVNAGDSFGEPVMFLQRPALVDAEAATDALVLHLPREAVFDEIDHSPVFARRIIAGLSLRVESLVQDIARQSLGSGRERLVDYLLRGMETRDGISVVTLPAAKSAVASHLRLTPEHFSRLLHELAADGLVQVRGRRITVPDPARLAADGARPSTRNGNGRPEPEQALA